MLKTSATLMALAPISWGTGAGGLRNLEHEVADRIPITVYNIAKMVCCQGQEVRRVL